MKKITITEQIEEIIFTLLKKNPKGLRWSQLLSEIKKSDPRFHPKTVNGTVWKIIEKYPDRIYKPEKGLFRSVEYKSQY